MRNVLIGDPVPSQRLHVIHIRTLGVKIFEDTFLERWAPGAASTLAYLRISRAIIKHQRSS